MAPELVEEFTRAFHEEINRQNSVQELRVVEHQSELARVSRKLKGLYHAIADGLRTPGLRDELMELEARQARLRELIDQSSPTRASPTSKAGGGLSGDRFRPARGAEQPKRRH